MSDCPSCLFDQLDAPIMIQIFKHLSLEDLYRKRLVCCHWHTLIDNFILGSLKNVAFFVNSNSYTLHNYRFKRKDICYKTSSSEKLLKVVGFHYNSKEVQFFNIDLNDESFFDSLSGFKNLDSLAFINCIFVLPKELLSNNFSSLTSLTINSWLIKDIDVETIGTILTNLEDLDLSFCTEIRGAYIFCLSNTLRRLSLSNCRLSKLFLLSLKELIDKGAELTSLNLKKTFHYTAFNFGFNDDLFYDLLCSKVLTKSLTELEITPTFCLEYPESFTPSIDNLKKLVIEEKNFKLNYFVTNNFLVWLLKQQLPNLNYLQIHLCSQLSYSDFQNCIDSCPNLRTLKLYLKDHCLLSNLMDDTFSKLALLEVLFCQNVLLNDRILKNIITNCEHLKTIVLYFSSTISAVEYSITEGFILYCREFYEKNPSKSINISIRNTQLPTHKLFTLPPNLNLRIYKKNFE